MDYVTFTFFYSGKGLLTSWYFCH